MERTNSIRALSSSEKHEVLHGLLEDYYFNHLTFEELSSKSGISRSSIYRMIRTFESENPQMSEQMKKHGKDVTPEDYKKLVRENLALKKQLSQERLRADFYEEMVAFGKEVYGIDLKKAGTK